MEFLSNERLATTLIILWFIYAVVLIIRKHKMPTLPEIVEKMKPMKRTSKTRTSECNIWNSHEQVWQESDESFYQRTNK